MFDDRSHQGRNEQHRVEPGGMDVSVIPIRSVLAAGEVVALLGLSEAAIRRAIDDGELVAIRHGTEWHVAREELVRFARQRNLPLPLVPREQVVALPVDSTPALPVPSSELIGRDAEVARLITLLEDPATRLITLTGPGGIGKTRLALAAAEAMQERLADGALFVDLSAVMRASAAVPAIAQALGLREHAGLDQRSQIARFLRAKELLLILDNVEQIIDAGPEIMRIARQATGTTVLVTSRAPLRVSDEREMPVPPLPLASHDATPVELLASDAGRLFVARARARDPSFVVDEQSAPFIAQICERLDGLPLAIELAAARAKLLTPRQLHDRLERTLTLLTHGDRDAPPRHLTMRDAIAWSYDLLASEEQRLFRQLAIFAGGFTLDAAEWVGGGESEHDDVPASTLDRLEALLNQSMVVREVGLDGEPRFRLLETIRSYGLERLSAAEEAGFRDVHARYYGELTQRLRPLVVTESARAPLERLTAEDANLRAALAWLADQNAAADFGAMVAALSGYWFAYSHLTDGESWIQRALARREQMPPVDRARLLIAAAISSGFRGDVARAELANAEGLPLSRVAGDAFDIAMALTSYGASRNQLEQFTEAAALLEEGRTVAESIADPQRRAAMMGRALANLSVTARGRGDFERATALCEAALDCYRGLGFDLAETRARMDLAGIANDTGDVSLMVTHCQTCLARTGERGDMRVVWVALSGIASACSTWDQPEMAVLLYAAADALRERVGLAMSLLYGRADTERDLVLLREALGGAQFAATWNEGHALPLAGVLAIAATAAPAANGAKPASPIVPSQLTRREQEVLRLLAAGQSDRDIAEALFIGPRTVSWHVGSILSKLGLSSRTQLAIRVHTDGLL